MFARPLRIHMWSGPRNVSTATMYAFRQRPDTQVLDEPLYAHYLARADIPHPGQEAILAAMETNGARVIQSLLHDPAPKPVLFIKHMAHHLIDLPWDFMAEGRHFLLIREPRAMLPSLARVIGHPTLADTGLALQAKLLEHLRTVGHEPLVVDSRALLLDPKSVLQVLCARLDLAFDAQMLRWPAGPKPEDGIWAPHWYQAVHASTGFQPYRPPAATFPAQFMPLLEECQPYYDQLLQYAIQTPSDLQA